MVSQSEIRMIMKASPELSREGARKRGLMMDKIISTRRSKREIGKGRFEVTVNVAGRQFKRIFLKKSTVEKFKKGAKILHKKAGKGTSKAKITVRRIN